VVRKLVQEHRWSLIVIYLALLAISVFALVRSEQVYRRQAREIRSSQYAIQANKNSIKAINAFRIERLQFVNALLKRSREADLRQCKEIEQIKTQVRLTVATSDKLVDGFVGRIPGYTEQDARNAHKLNHDTLVRFRRRNCTKLPNPAP
jgi:uncharacterized membrane protein YdfJ with MMPL/SSD domain